MARIVGFLFLACLLGVAMSHICILEPNQRGGADVSSAGNPTCFQPQAPCGTVAPADPTVTLPAGSVYYVHVQQNLNHYNVGRGGFIDIAFGMGFNQTSDDQFLDRNVLEDFWPHFQGTQTNFSIPVLVPDTACTHCTLRARYHPNKPTEPIFHNCADISIVTPEPLPFSASLFATLDSQGGRNSLAGDVSSFVEIDILSGKVSVVHDNAFGTRLSDTPFIQSQGLITVNEAAASDRSIVFLGQWAPSLPFNVAPDVLATMDQSGNVKNVTLAYKTVGVEQWVSVTPYDSDDSYLVVGQIANTDGSYSYALYETDLSTGALSVVAATPSGEFTYVNILWGTYDSCSGLFYLLAGDENSLYALNAKLYTFDTNKNTVSGVVVDNSEYTITSIHSINCGTVVALSPGLVESPASERVWSVVTYDATDGSVISALPVTQPGEYNYYYGGGIYGDAVCDNYILQLFQRASDDVLVLLAIDATTGEIVSSSMPDVGVNNSLEIVNPVVICNSK